MSDGRVVSPIAPEPSRRPRRGRGTAPLPGRAGGLAGRSPGGTGPVGRRGPGRCRPGRPHPGHHPGHDPVAGGGRTARPAARGLGLRAGRPGGTGPGVPADLGESRPAARDGHVGVPGGGVPAVRRPGRPAADPARPGSGGPGRGRPDPLGQGPAGTGPGPGRTQSGASETPAPGRPAHGTADEVVELARRGADVRSVGPLETDRPDRVDVAARPGGGGEPGSGWRRTSNGPAQRPVCARQKELRPGRLCRHGGRHPGWPS